MESGTGFYSQHGEDAFLANIFADKTSGTCVEVGALDGLKESTTLYFERKGWSCVLVEANPELAEKARANRRAKVFSCAAGKESGRVDFLIAKGAEYLSTTVHSAQHTNRIEEAGAVIERVNIRIAPLDEILGEAGVTQVDFATIDVEGAELEVLKGFDLERWKPRVLVLEDNSGGHDRRVLRWLNAHGYECFYNDGLNDWYAKRDDKALLTPERVKRERRRRIRARIYEWTVGTLPLSVQDKLVRWKRKWLGKL